MTVLCPCCNKPFSRVDDIEPCFGLPDEIFAMSEDERERRCKLSPSVCTIDWPHKKSAPQYFVRALLPFRVEGRDRPFHWGVWTRVGEDVFMAYMEATEAEQDGLPVSADLLREDYFWPCRIANDIVSALEDETIPSVIEMSARLKWHPDRQRPRIYFYEGHQHPLADLQRMGVSIEQTIEWLKPFHAMVAN